MIVKCAEQGCKYNDGAACSLEEISITDYLECANYEALEGEGEEEEEEEEEEEDE